MQQIIDIDTACRPFAEGHDWNTGTDSGLGIDGCSHFGPCSSIPMPNLRNLG